MFGTPNMPDRQPVGDLINATLARLDRYHVLLPRPLDGLEVVQHGPMVVRYAIEYLGKPQSCITPELVVLDYGEGMAGEAALDFLLNKSNLYPRGDVLGWRNDGQDEMIVIKKLDLTQPIRFLIYPDWASTTPQAEAVALIGDDWSAFPQRLLSLARYRFATPADFLKYIHDE